MMAEQSENKKAKRTFWAVALFYGLIAFEFFYMATPLAFYFYAVYKPGLTLLFQIPGMAWLSGFFLPHIVVETSSPLINLHNVIGAVLFVAGMLIFIISAVQVYAAKILKRGVVTGGLYRFIRHPQYTGFALSGFGLLLLWPRFLVLVMFVSLLFAYYLLARTEEKECIAKFGPAYRDYRDRTCMFFPLRISFITKWTAGLQQKTGTVVFLILLYMITLLVSIGLARGVQSLSLDHLYLYTTAKSVFISVIELEQKIFRQLVETALADEVVQSGLQRFPESRGVRLIGYVVPAGWFISEIPMHPTESHTEHYLRSGTHDEQTWKIIFTLPTPVARQDADVKELIRDTRTIKPVLEVWVDISIKIVITIKEPPATSRYENIPVPVY